MFHRQTRLWGGYVPFVPSLEVWEVPHSFSVPRCITVWWARRWTSWLFVCFENTHLNLVMLAGVPSEYITSPGLPVKKSSFSVSCLNAVMLMLFLLISRVGLTNVSNEPARAKLPSRSLKVGSVWKLIHAVLITGTKMNLLEGIAQVLWMGTAGELGTAPPRNQTGPLWLTPQNCPVVSLPSKASENCLVLSHTEGSRTYWAGFMLAGLVRNQRQKAVAQKSAFLQATFPSGLTSLTAEGQMSIKTKEVPFALSQIPLLFLERTTRRASRMGTTHC